jgi:hypothetical protein
MSDERPMHSIAVPCGQDTRLTHYWPIGTTDPAQYRCGHAFEICLDKDGIHCRACDLFISGECLSMLKWMAGHRYSQKGQRLAEDNTRLAEENRDVLADNARLRRKLEALEKKR